MKKVTFSSYDSADYLQTGEDIALYLEAVLEEGSDDPAFIAHSLGVVARARNMSQLSRDAGLTREGLYKALSADGNPTFATVVKVAKALGLRLEFQPRSPRHTPAKHVRPVNPRRPAGSVKGGKRTPAAGRADAADKRHAVKPRKRA